MRKALFKIFPIRFCNILPGREPTAGRLSCVRPELGRAQGGLVEWPPFAPDMKRPGRSLWFTGSWPWYDEPMASVASALVQKLNRFLPLKPDELASLAELEARRRPIPAHTEIVHERQEGHHAFILQEGWACAYKLLPDGGRQVIDFSVPGDFMGLRSVLLRTSDHGFAAVTDIVVAEVSAQQMIDTFQRRAAIGGGDPVGGLARRGDGGRASGQHRSAQRPGAHGASPARAGAAPAARGARLGKRLRLPAQPASSGRCAGAHRDPREPRPAPAARAWPGDLPGGQRGDFTISLACATSPNTTAAISTRATGSGSEDRAIPPSWRSRSADPG